MTRGPGDILRLIRSGEAVTRGELGEATGLSRLTVAQRVDSLVDAGIIREAGAGDATGGRRATRFVFDPADAIVLAAAIEADGAVAGILDPHGHVLATHRLDVRVEDGPSPVLDRVLDGFDALLSDAGLDRARIGAAGISVPGPVDPATHRLADPPVMPGWGDWPVIEAVRERFDVPVSLENDADAMAYGEFVEAGETAANPFVLVKASSFIGSGLVLGGRIYRGVDGGAGDIGHVQLGGDALCRCGRRGCLAAEASGVAVLRRLGEAGVPVSDEGALDALIAAGDAAASAELTRAGELIGRVLAAVVGIVNPATITIGGSLAHPALIAGVRTAVYAGSLPRATRHLDVSSARLGEDAALIGLSRVAIDELFAPEAINARFA
ncbi:ROK family transcriptional regulator [Agromyces archimandritae]|uniref:ROK family transcriptional regulator n=1 Tax=Agromyces archimandritae TaxID=2781962 RepID=A0A975IMV8_9MICO|nr:ROK family transcriptional regulator [Agromyces archimandritae]QTX03938.1 ROK family transcriptional regulator [Agromyces archimandritae]